MRPAAAPCCCATRAFCAQHLGGFCAQYLGGAEEHYHHTAGGGVDLWASDRSAVGYDGIYSAIMYATHASQLIEAHPKDRGLFLYVAFSDTHEPIEAPDEYVDVYPDTMPPCRRIYNGMASAVDDAVKNISAALHRSGLWESTLVVWSSDNGGPSLVPGQSCANNFPMRGSKGNDCKAAAPFRLLPKSEKQRLHAQSKEECE